MTRDDITTVVLDVLGDIAPEVDVDNLDHDTDLREQMELDSFDFLTFLQDLADRFGIEIPERDAAKLGTVNGCVDYIAERIPAHA